MEILKQISERRSYRALKSDGLPTGALKRIVEAGTLAPSCYNNQPWRIVAAEGSLLDELKATLPEGNAWATRAPAIIAIAAKESEDCRLEDGRDYALFDSGLCAMNMMTQACAEGLIAHPIAGYNPKRVKSVLGLPADSVLIVLIVIGQRGDPNGEDGKLLAPWQAAADHAERQRKAISDVASFGRWNPAGSN